MLVKCINLKKNGKVCTSKFVGTGPSSYEKKNLPGRGLTKVEKHCSISWHNAATRSKFIVCLMCNYSDWPSSVVF